MKKVEAIIKPFKLDDATSCLAKIGVRGMTIYEVKGFGKQKGHLKSDNRDAEYFIDFLPHVKIEFVINDELVDQAIASLEQCARTGKIGDGKIFVYPVEEAVRIRTGERGNDAL